MKKSPKNKKLVRWSFEPSKETTDAYDVFVEQMGKLGHSINKSRLIDALVLDGLRREVQGNITGVRK